MSENLNENVDWECQNCGEFNVQPRNDPPRGARQACGKTYGWALPEHERP